MALVVETGGLGPRAADPVARGAVALAGLLRRPRPAASPAASPAPADGGTTAAAIRSGLDLAPLAFFAVFLWLGYSYIGPPLEHPRYLIPASYALLAVACGAWANPLGSQPSPRTAGLRAGAAFLLVAGAAAVLPWAVGREAAAMTSIAWGSDRIEAHAEMARWTRHHGFSTPPF